MSASPSDYARAVRRARLIGALEAASVTRRGQSVDERYAAVFRAIAGPTVFDRHQERHLFQVFADALANSSSEMRAAAFMAADGEDDDVTEVAPPPVRVRKTRRFLAWLLPCLVLGCSSPRRDAGSCHVQDMIALETDWCCQ